MRALLNPLSPEWRTDGGAGLIDLPAAVIYLGFAPAALALFGIVVGRKFAFLAVLVVLFLGCSIPTVQVWAATDNPMMLRQFYLPMMPLAVPGMALGLAYIFFFNNPANPFNFLYGTMGILVLVTVTHFYTVSHLTAVTALKQMDPEFESVSASLKTPFYRTFLKITVPVCLPAILDVSMYLFLNAMTTVSAVVFLYSSDTTLASVAAVVGLAMMTTAYCRTWHDSVSLWSAMVDRNPRFHIGYYNLAKAYKRGKKKE